MRAAIGQRLMDLLIQPAAIEIGHMRDELDRGAHALRKPVDHRGHHIQVVVCGKRPRLLVQRHSDPVGLGSRPIDIQRYRVVDGLEDGGMTRTKLIGCPVAIGIAQPHQAAQIQQLRQHLTVADRKIGADALPGEDHRFALAGDDQRRCQTLVEQPARA
ncbi:hypothetical protein SDC9_105633 [bioreactor metagenome]|uniref:Uncharacterized protein n=1 Tax=bioreactor metagenome TaxID=1076179 RepID=A0A645B040_9ZZZZ